MTTTMTPDEKASKFAAASLTTTDDLAFHVVGAGMGDYISYNDTRDYRECTSPEQHHVSLWPPLKGGGNVRSMAAASDDDDDDVVATCGLFSAADTTTPFAGYFTGSLWKEKIEPMLSRCTKLVVFGVAFGGDFVRDLDAPHVHAAVNATDLLERHGRCFFVLTTERDIRNNIGIVRKYNDGPEERSTGDPVVMGHNILIPLPENALPYRNPRRNVKLLKFTGQHVLFQRAETVVWQDAKFFRDDFVGKQPVDYGALVEDDDDYSSSCVTAMGLPVHKVTVGDENIRNGLEKDGRYTVRYEHHCQTIIAALIKRPNVTDSSQSLIRQCDAYLRHVYQQEGSTDAMNQGLVDSAFIVWNHKTRACRDFSRSFRCTIIDQIQCHSDRDQVTIPFALYKMGVTGKYRPRKGDEPTEVNEAWDPRIHDLEFHLTDEKATSNNHHDGEEEAIRESSKDPVMLRITRSSCHWYFSRLGNCRTDLTEAKKPTLAVVVAGWAKRYVVSGMTDHLIKPLVTQQNTEVDYYVMLGLNQHQTYRGGTDEYMKHRTYDPLFSDLSGEKDTSKIKAYLYDEISNIINLSGANVGGIHIQNQLWLVSPKLRKKELEMKRARPEEGLYYRFPTLDLRPYQSKYKAGDNRDLLKVYLGLQTLWKKHLWRSENYIGLSYDYIMVLRDDAAWLGDFNLQDLIDTNPAADAYVLSCDARKSSPMIANEYSELGVVVRRSKAAAVGRYFDQLLDADLDGCHSSVRSMVRAERGGCNSGMLFYWIMQRNNVTVQRVPQSLFPIGGLSNLKTNDTEEVCIHEMCQSRESPLVIPQKLKGCNKIKLS